MKKIRHFEFDAKNRLSPWSSNGDFFLVFSDTVLVIWTKFQLYTIFFRVNPLNDQIIPTIRYQRVCLECLPIFGKIIKVFFDRINISITSGENINITREISHKQLLYKGYLCIVSLDAYYFFTTKCFQNIFQIMQLYPYLKHGS